MNVCFIVVTALSIGAIEAGILSSAVLRTTGAAALLRLPQRWANRNVPLCSELEDTSNSTMNAFSNSTLEMVTPENGTMVEVKKKRRCKRLRSTASIGAKPEGCFTMAALLAPILMK